MSRFWLISLKGMLYAQSKQVCMVQIVPAFLIFLTYLEPHLEIKATCAERSIQCLVYHATFNLQYYCMCKGFIVPLICHLNVPTCQAAIRNTLENSRPIINAVFNCIILCNVYACVHVSFHVICIVCANLMFLKFEYHL